MDIWDFLEDELEISDLDQALISSKHIPDIDEKTCLVDRELVNSKEYHDKFEQLPLPKAVQESVYKQTGRLLEFVDGQPEERLLALDARTGEFLVDNFQRTGSIYHTGFISSECEKIEKCEHKIVLIHNHSLNGRPSGQDLLSFLHQDKVQMSIVACHDGALYAIKYVSPEFERLYNEELEMLKFQINDIREIKKLALTHVEILNEQTSKKHKLFKILKL